MSNYAESDVESAIEGRENEELDEWFEGWGEIKYANLGSVVMHIDIAGDTNVPVTKVASFGGEGQGDSLWVVVQVGTQLFRKSGYYASHYGSDWDGDFTEVRASQKTVTVYE